MPYKQMLANSLDPDQMERTVASDQDLQCLHKCNTGISIYKNKKKNKKKTVNLARVE